MDQDEKQRKLEAGRAKVSANISRVTYVNFTLASSEFEYCFVILYVCNYIN